MSAKMKLAWDNKERCFENRIFFLSTGEYRALYFSAQGHFVPQFEVSNITYIDLSEPNENISRKYVLG